MSCRTSRTFLRVADLGSFTAAAQAMGVRQPTVSRRVAELERSLGVALVVRTTRSVALTEAGLRYLEPARVALDALNRAREAAHAPGEVKGLLRVAAPVSFTTVWLAPRLGSFFEAHPALDVVMELAERHVDLVADGIDLAVRIGGPDHATLTGRRLRPIERWWVVAPSFLERHGPVQQADDLEHHTGLVFASPGRQPLGFRLADTVIAPRRRITSSNGMPLRRFVLDGLGIALLPDWLVGDDVDSGQLVRVLPELCPPTLDLWVVWPRHRFQRSATRAFVDWMGQLHASG